MCYVRFFDFFFGGWGGVVVVTCDNNAPSINIRQARDELVMEFALDEGT